MKSKFLIFTLFTACLALTTSCASKKGYQGDKLPATELARIHQGSNKLKVKKRNTTESAFLVRVDTVSVGSYMKGFPKYADVLPGSHTVEIRHFQQWKDKAAMSGAMFGLIGASIAESNNPHTHYKLTFEVEKGKQYTIVPQTDSGTETARLFVIDNFSNDTIPTLVVKIEKQPNKGK